MNKSNKSGSDTNVFSLETSLTKYNQCPKDLKMLLTKNI